MGPADRWLLRALLGILATAFFAWARVFWLKSDAVIASQAAILASVAEVRGEQLAATQERAELRRWLARLESGDSSHAALGWHDEAGAELIRQAARGGEFARRLRLLEDTHRRKE